MSLRSWVVVAGVLAAGAAAAEPLDVNAARRFVVGKMFSFTFFDGPRGAGRIYGDGSAVGTVQFGGSGPIRYASLPPGTLHAKGAAVCASLRGMPIEPCFNLNKINAQSFRGSVAGLSIAYCDFTERAAPSPVRTTWRLRPSPPLSLNASGANAQASTNDSQE